MRPLSREPVRRTSAPVSNPTPPDLFDRRLRALRRDRAASAGPELVLLDRAFDEGLDRLRDIRRRFDRALLVGAPTPDWRQRLTEFASEIDILDPGPLFASGSNGITAEEDRHDFGEQRYDLVMAVGTLDTVNQLPLALQLLRRAMRPDAPFIGALAGGDSLPALRSAMIEADRATGGVAARTHPRIGPSSLAGLLSGAGFVMPVVDVDRVSLRYSSLGDLVRDLRAMGATNLLAERPPPLSKSAAKRAAEAFERAGSGGRTEEALEILHFLGWKEYSRQALS